VAVCLTDVLDDGLSLVYSFYDPDLAAQSLGTYMILDHVALARQIGLPYVYLGYWVPGSAKMGYKSRFDALEIYHDGAWREIGDPALLAARPHPLSVRPITEQVAAISLPQTDTGTRR
jgi:arginine-tRNA-protein transferase